MHTSKNVHDVFNHRVRAASRRATLGECISKLCNYFGLQSLPDDAVHLVEELRPVERDVLNKLYTEHIILSMQAILRARELRAERRDDKQKQLEE